MLTKETRVATWNVNSIRKRIKNGQFYAIFDCDADILVLTEIRCKVDQLFSYEDFWLALETRGYRYCAWHSARDGVLKHGYAGVAILSKLAPISFIFGFQNDEDTEGRVLTIRFKDALLIGAYCPARPECMQSFLESLKNHNQLLKRSLGLPVFLVGDINMIGAKSDAIEHSIPYPNATQMCQDYFNTLIFNMGLIDSALIPNSNSAYDAVNSSKNVTWYERPHRPKFGMRIDYILVPHQFSSLVQNYARLAVIGSDHLPIICTILSESGEKREVTPLISRNGLYNLLNLAGVSPMQQPVLTQNDCKMLRALDKLMLDLPMTQPKFALYYAELLPLKIKTSSIRIEVRVGYWRYANALIDTGSTYCLIDRKILDDILATMPTAGKVTEINPILLSLGDGSTASKVNPNAVTMLDVYFQTREGYEISVCQKFFVCPELNELLVIGHRFFQDNRGNGADLSYENNSLLLKGMQLPWNKTNCIPENMNILTGVLCDSHNIEPNAFGECNFQVLPQKNFGESGGSPQSRSRPQGAPNPPYQLQNRGGSPQSKSRPQGVPNPPYQLRNRGSSPQGGGNPHGVPNPPKPNNFFTNDLVVEEGIVHARIQNDRSQPLSVLAGMQFEILVCDSVSLEVELDKLALDALRVRCPRRDDSLSAPMYSEDTDRTGAVLSSPTSSGGSVCPTPNIERTTWGRSTTAELGPDPFLSAPTKPSPRLFDSTVGAQLKAPTELAKPRNGPDPFLSAPTKPSPRLFDSTVGAQLKAPTELAKPRNGPEPFLSAPTKPSPRLSDSTVGAKRKAPTELAKSSNKKQCGDSIYHKVTENRLDVDDKLRRALYQYELGSPNHFNLPKLLALHIKLTEDLELAKSKICLNQKVYEEQAHEIALCHLLCDRNAAEPKIDLTITEIEYVNQDAKTGPLDASKLSKSEKESLLQAIDVSEFATNGDIDPAKLPAHLRGAPLSIKTMDVSLQQLCFLIKYYLCKKGRDKLFSPDNIPGRCKNYECSPVKLIDPNATWNEPIIPLNPKDKEELKSQIEKYLKGDIIEPSNSSRSVKTLLIKKPNGRHQIASTLGKLNDNCVRDNYPLCSINDCLDYLYGRKFFSTVDICGAYFTVPIREEDREKFAFITHLGLFHYKVLCYGWKNSQAEFCRMLDQVLNGLRWKDLCSYADDVINFGGDDFLDHCDSLDRMFDRFQNENITLSTAKLLLFQKSVEYLGHEISKAGVKPSKKNIEKLLAVKIDSSKSLLSFLQMLNFFRKHIPKLSTKRLLFTENLQRWKGFSPEEQLCIDEFKTILTTSPILAHPNFDEEFFLEVDASKLGCGCMLYQKGKDGLKFVIMFGSKAFKDTEKNYPAHQMEVMAASWAMNLNRRYLNRSKFTLITDNVVLKWLRRKKGLESSMAKYVVETQDFDFVVEHKPGQLLVASDLLSRKGVISNDFDEPTQAYIDKKYMPLALTEDISKLVCDRTRRLVEGLNPDRSAVVHDVPETISHDTWMQHQMSDPELRKIIDDLQLKDKVLESKSRYYTIENSLLCYKPPNIDCKPRVCVPQNLRLAICRHFHGVQSHDGGHKTIRAAASLCYWPRMTDDIKKWIRHCSICMKRKTPKPWKQGLAREFQRATKPWQVLCMDFLHRNLPESPDGYKYCLIVMDVFTRWPIGIPLRTKEDGMELVEALERDVFDVFGFPQTLHSDNEAVLIGNIIHRLLRRRGVKHTRIMTNHPQANPAERVMKYLNAAFTMALEQYTDWPKLLSKILFGYRIAVNEATGYSPFYLMFNRNPRLPLTLTIEDPCAPPEYTNYDDYVNASTENIKLALNKAAQSQNLRQQKNNLLRNKTQVETIFEKGDGVYYLEPNGVPIEKISQEMKEDGIFAPQTWLDKWSGPHIIKSRKSNENYIMWHTERREDIRVHVSTIRQYSPFSDTLEDTSKLQITDWDVKPVPESLQNPAINDLILMFSENDKQTPYSVGAYLGVVKDSTWPVPYIKVQWLISSNQAAKELSTQSFRKGWIKKDGQTYSSKDIPTDPDIRPYTNCDEPWCTILRNEIIFFGFQLNSKHKLPQEALLAAQRHATTEARENISSPAFPGAAAEKNSGHM